MTIADTKLEISDAARRTRYHGVMMSLHWLIAAAVLTNIGLGLYMGTLARTDPMKFEIIQLHKSVGLTVLILSIAIVIWRLTHRAPPLPAGMAPPLKLLASAVHVLLYVLIVALPLTGWLMVSSSPHGGSLSYFGLFDWPLIGFLAHMAQPDKKALVGTFAETHETLAWIMIGLVPLHVVGALWHQFFGSESVMRRMVPWG